MTSAPPALTKCFLENSFSCSRPVMSCTCLCHHGRGLLDRGQDSRIRPAAAQMSVHRRADLILGRILRRRKQVSSLDHHAVLAVTAMRYLHIDPGLLQRMQRRSGSGRALALSSPESRKTLERSDALTRHRRHRGHAGAYLLAVQQHRAGATLRKTTAEAGAMQVELVMQNVKERSVKAGLDAMRQAVDLDLDAVRHISSPIFD